ncbi:MAG: hypothetical protein O3B01_16205 [Planctomycetota bacterium]|nr:hypothetical protein [Planctomycetota bacterium]
MNKPLLENWLARSWSNGFSRVFVFPNGKTRLKPLLELRACSHVSRLQESGE